jgi:hypothetical protein
VATIPEVSGFRQKTALKIGDCNMIVTLWKWCICKLEGKSLTHLHIQPCWEFAHTYTIRTHTVLLPSIIHFILPKCCETAGLLRRCSNAATWLAGESMCPSRKATNHESPLTVFGLFQIRCRLPYRRLSLLIPEIAAMSSQHQNV